MSNPLLCCHSQRVLWLLNPNVEFTGYFLRPNGGVSGIWIRCHDLYTSNDFAKIESFYHRSIYKHIYNSAHDSVNFKIANFWNPCNITDFTAFLLLLSPHQHQLNWLSTPLSFTHHDNVGTLINLTLGRNSWIKIYCSSVSSEGNEFIFVRSK